MQPLFYSFSQFKLQLNGYISPKVVMNRIFNAVIFILIVSLFGMDLAMPLGVAAGTPYGLIVFLTLWSRGQRATYLVAMAGITLTIVGFFMSPSTVSAMHAVIINRTLAIVIISVSAILVIQRKKADQKISALNILSITDPLTRIKNRRAFNETIQEELERAKRYGRDLSLAILDLDRFKLINDTYGHVAGDTMLKQLAYEVNGLIRRSDLLYRLGGDEFAIIFIETDLAHATIVSEKIRDVHSQLAMQIGNHKMTISIGIATLQENDDTSSLYKRADDALYHSKHHGRNKVSTSEDIATA